MRELLGLQRFVTGPYARYLEIKTYAEENYILDWRAIDDASQEFPEDEVRLISVNQIWIGKKQIDVLKVG